MGNLEDSAAHLELDLDAPEVALQHLVSAASTFAALLREVARAYLGTAQDPVRWIVEVRPGSVKLPLRPTPALEQVSPSAFPEVIATVTEGIALLDRTAKRPAHFTDKALEQAKALANLAGPEVPINVRNGRAKVPVTKRIAANVDEVLGAADPSYGTVEGLLEALNIHGTNRTFGVYDALTGKKVECKLIGKVTVDDLGPAIGKRVAVRGLILSRSTGERISVQADELDIFDAEGLPSPEDVIGILKGYEREE
jgi:hypothetical protein